MYIQLMFDRMMSMLAGLGVWKVVAVEKKCFVVISLWPERLAYIVLSGVW